MTRDNANLSTASSSSLSKIVIAYFRDFPNCQAPNICEPPTTPHSTTHHTPHTTTAPEKKGKHRGRVNVKVV
jgi:hypothetical protein